MSVLDRAALEDSPLADLHAIASEMTIDGYRRLRKAALIDAILDRAGISEPDGDGADGADSVDGADGVERGAGAEAEAEAQEPDAQEPEAQEPEAQATPADGELAGHQTAAQPGVTVDVAELFGVIDELAELEPGEPVAAAGTGATPASGDATRRRRGRRGGRGRSAGREDAGGEAATEPEAEPESAPEAEPEPRPEPEEVIVEGVVELLANGSGFIRSSPGETSDGDVYISATQVKRCELVTGDRVTGPRRAPRRSERFASLVRVDTINGRPAVEIADSTRYDELPLAFPSERIQFDSEDPTLKTIDWLTPIGRGSRVTITGAARAGKSELLRRIAETLVVQTDPQLLIALAGVRPEEITEWASGPAKPATAVSFAASADAQDQAVELVVDQARRIAARGGDAVVLIDSLDGLHPHSARKLLASARKIVDGGSLTLIATASRPFGGETTVIALDAALTSAGRFPAIDIVCSGTIRAKLLVGEDGAGAIARAHAETHAGVI